MNNGDVFKKTIKDDLQEIKKCKIHILMIQEKNDQLCASNNAEIKRLNDVIENRLISAEDSLNKSGEKKIDTPIGWCSFRVQPDKWEYDEPKIIDWCKKIGADYFHTVEVLEKMNLKKDVQTGIVGEAVPGLTVTPQKPKFGYKIKEVI